MDKYSDSIQSKSIAVAVAPSISRFLGVVPILPGESADLYQASLDTLIEELGARFPALSFSSLPKTQHSALSRQAPQASSKSVNQKVQGLDDLRRSNKIYKTNPFSYL